MKKLLLIIFLIIIAYNAYSFFFKFPPKPESKPLPPEEDIVPDIITPSLTNYTFNEVTGEIFFTFYFKLFGLVRYIFFLISKNIGRIERKIIARIIGKR